MSFTQEWVASLSPQDRALLERALQPKWSPYIAHRPHPTQQAFLLLDCKEALFGGSAGGGKSNALLSAALQYADVPGYSALILRRSFPDLTQRGALIPRSKEWLFPWEPAGVTWNGHDHQWTFPTEDPARPAVLRFGHADHPDDVVRLYQGSEYHFVGVDELTQWEEGMVEFLLTRIRKAETDPIPLRFRATANPGGIGHQWVKDRYIGTPAEPVREPDRAFIPSSLEDNPTLGGVDGEYARTLQAIKDPVLRAQLLHGDWETRPAGKLFRKEWFRVVDAMPAGVHWIRYWDLAATEQGPEKKNDPDWTAGAKVGIHTDETGASVVCVADVRRERLSPAGVERFIRQTAEEDGRGVPIHIEQEPGSGGKNTIHTYASRVLFGWIVHGHVKTKAKAEMWRPLAAQAEAGNVLLRRAPWNSWWLEEAHASPQPGVHDDGLDAVAGGMAKAEQPPFVFV
jgi:predicted phage terminase large subunit-like protein